MDVDVSTVAGYLASSRTDPHADGSTFIPKSRNNSFATNPTGTFFANALKVDRNYRVKFHCPPNSNEIVRAISFYDPQEFHFMTDKFHLMTEPTGSSVSSGIK